LCATREETRSDTNHDGDSTSQVSARHCVRRSIDDNVSKTSLPHDVCILTPIVRIGGRTRRQSQTWALARRLLAQRIAIDRKSLVYLYFYMTL
jgi:hypothetical protein